MSILVENDSGWVICHEKAVEDIYKNVNIGSQDLKENLRYKADLFNISVPFYYKMENSYMPPDCVSTEEPSNAKLAVKCRMNGSSAEVTPYCVLDSVVKPHCDLAVEPDRNIVTATQVDPNFASSSQSNDVENALTTNTKRKRKRKEPLNEGELAAIQFHEENRDILDTALTSLVDLARDRGYFQPISEIIKGESNKRSRAVAADVGFKISFADVFVQYQNEFKSGKSTNGVSFIENTMLPSESLLGRVWEYQGDVARTVNTLSERFLLPPRSRFLLSDLRGLQQNVDNLGRFNLIVTDPPWQNRSAKRNKMYHTMKNEELHGIPMRHLIEDNCLVVVWATNKQAQLKFIQDRLFPAWKVEFLAHWFWLKVTKSGEPVNELDSTHKKPYESIIIGHCCKDKDQCGHTKIPNKKVIVSVPCALHSKKPPLGDILKSYLPCEPKCLELFGRNLWAGWTSWGDEVLLHQHIDIFESVT